MAKRLRRELARDYPHRHTVENLDGVGLRAFVVALPHEGTGAMLCVFGPDAEACRRCIRLSAPGA